MKDLLSQISGCGCLIAIALCFISVPVGIISIIALLIIYSFFSIFIADDPAVRKFSGVVVFVTLAVALCVIYLYYPSSREWFILFGIVLLSSITGLLLGFFFTYMRIAPIVGLVACVGFGYYIFQIDNTLQYIMALILFPIWLTKVVQDMIFRKIIKNNNCYDITAPFWMILYTMTILPVAYTFFGYDYNNLVLTISYGILLLFMGYYAVNLFLLSSTINKLMTNFSYGNIDCICRRIHADTRGKYHFVEKSLIRFENSGWIVVKRINGIIFYFQVDFLDKCFDYLEEITISKIQLSIDELNLRMLTLLNFQNKETLVDFVLLPENNIELLDFKDGKFFVNYQNMDKVRTCISCGFSELFLESKNKFEEWICSDSCKETEEICSKIAIKNTTGTVISNPNIGIAAGMASSEAANTWCRSAKMLSSNSRGHGFAAENANTMVDKVCLRKASVIGGDNAKNGADRSVDSTLIQTKYCSHATKSVSQAFNSTGGYRYMDDQGKPMQLEVPRDQYKQAIEIMKEKIAEGKVPGVRDPEMAKEIVRKGHITYKQAVNITKFGTFESLAYDAYSGTIVGVYATSISFTISTAINYWHNRDLKKAMYLSLSTSLKTGTMAFSSYVIASQLQRVDVIKSFMERSIQFNFNNTSFGKTLAKGITKSVTGALAKDPKQAAKIANRAIRGAVVSNLAVIGILSMSEVYRLVSGNISRMQCIKNIIVAAGSTTGGTIGAILGGAALSFIPIAGTITGSVIGGIVGGTIGGKITKGIMDEIIEDDRIEMIRLISQQFCYLSRIFFFTNSDIEVISKTLETVINSNTKIFEQMYASSNRRAFANKVLKPLCVKHMQTQPSITTAMLSVEAIGEVLNETTL